MCQYRTDSTFAYEALPSLPGTGNRKPRRNQHRRDYRHREHCHPLNPSWGWPSGVSAHASDRRPPLGREHRTRSPPISPPRGGLSLRGRGHGRPTLWVHPAAGHESATAGNKGRPRRDGDVAHSAPLATQRPPIRIFLGLLRGPRARSSSNAWICAAPSPSPACLLEITS